LNPNLSITNGAGALYQGLYWQFWQQICRQTDRRNRLDHQAAPEIAGSARSKSNEVATEPSSASPNCLMQSAPTASQLLGDTAAVLSVATQADLQIRLLTEHLGVRAGWTGSGIEFHRLELGQAHLLGCAEAGDVSFVAQLWFPRRCAWDTSVGPPWQVEGEITVRCDARVDCGPHFIEELPAQLFDSPLDATRALLEAATWLRERGTSEPLASWRQRDTRSGHD
jgi:hypothetical protein